MFAINIQSFFFLAEGSTEALDIALGVLALLIVGSGLFMLIKGTTAMNDTPDKK